MSKKPPPGKKPDDEVPEETNLDDLDLESLLADDDVLEGGGPEKTPPAKEPTSEEPLVIDDGEIDLVEEEPGAVGADDTPPMLPQPEEPEGAPGAETGQEEISIDDLLADDIAEASTGKDADMVEAPPPELEPDRTTAAIEEPQASDDEATRPVGEADEEKAGAEETGAAKKGGKFGKKFGKKFGAKKGFKKGKAAPAEEAAESSEAAEPAEAEAPAPTVGAEEPEEAPKKGKKEKPSKLKRGKAAKEASEDEVTSKERKPAAAVSARGSITFVCSECYEEFLLPPELSTEVVSCPECLHVGKRPDEDFIRKVKMHKSGEHKSLAMAIGCGALLLLVVLALVYVKSPYYAQINKAPDEMIVYGLLGGTGILGLLLVWLLVRFEKNRWEVYF